MKAIIEFDPKVEQAIESLCDSYQVVYSLYEKVLRNEVEMNLVNYERFTKEFSPDDMVELIERSTKAMIEDDNLDYVLINAANRALANNISLMRRNMGKQAESIENTHQASLDTSSLTEVAQDAMALFTKEEEEI